MSNMNIGDEEKFMMMWNGDLLDDPEAYDGLLKTESALADDSLLLKTNQHAKKAYDLIRFIKSAYVRSLELDRVKNKPKLQLNTNVVVNADNTYNSHAIKGMSINMCGKKAHIVNGVTYILN